MQMARVKALCLRTTGWIESQRVESDALLTTATATEEVAKCHSFFVLETNWYWTGDVWWIFIGK
jgi:hypothetical protein